MEQVSPLTFTLLVGDYDRSLRFYRDLLGFEMLFDADLGSSRHIKLSYPGFPNVHFTLWLACSETERAGVGRQSGGVAWIVVPVEDCRATHRRLLGESVAFDGEIIELPYGIQAIAIDPDGNRVGLFQDFATHDSES